MTVGVHVVLGQRRRNRAPASALVQPAAIAGLAMAAAAAKVATSPTPQAPVPTIRDGDRDRVAAVQLPPRPARLGARPRVGPDRYPRAVYQLYRAVAGRTCVRHRP